MRIAAELNGRYQTPEQVHALLSQLTGRPVPESVALFPPFHCEFGKNLHLGGQLAASYSLTQKRHSCGHAQAS